MYSNSKYRGGFHELVVIDQHDVRRWGMDYFDTVVDLGAYMGVFSMLMRMLHPKAKIIAIEPSLRNTDFLEKNIRHMDIIMDTRALGDGSTMYLQYGLSKRPGGDWFCNDEQEYSHPVETARLWQFFQEHRCSIDEKYLIKVDCEGAEKFLVGDSKSEEVLKNADHIALEIHAKGKGNKVSQNEYFLEWDDYLKWVYKLFGETHSINKVISKRRLGLGYYNISRM